MSTTCELVIAEFNEAESVGRTLFPAKLFDAVEVNGIDPVKLGKLEELAGGESYAEAMEHYVHPAYIVSDEGPWVTEMPHELVERLATLTADERAELAGRWFEIDEFASGWTAGDVTELLGLMCSFSATATQSHRALFMRFAR